MKVCHNRISSVKNAACTVFFQLLHTYLINDRQLQITHNNKNVAQIYVIYSILKCDTITHCTHVFILPCMVSFGARLHIRAMISPCKNAAQEKNNHRQKGVPFLNGKMSQDIWWLSHIWISFSQIHGKRYFSNHFNICFKVAVCLFFQFCCFFCSLHQTSNKNKTTQLRELVWIKESMNRVCDTKS